ncbi:putative Mitochondrial calcium uniporter [Leishmania utingensis]|uniref:Mitochondrial calcium uniporter n=1 Tax=Leishmania utingensis TaxID=653362 RepID=A0AAW3AK36_9TRYP
MLPLELLRYRNSLLLSAAAAPLSRRCIHSSALAKETASTRATTLPTAFIMSCRFLMTAAAANDSSSAHSSPRNASIDVSQLRGVRETLKKTLAAKRQQLDAMEHIKVECAKIAYHYPDVFMKQLFAFLVLQAVVLFDWTYVHFGWNFVEPITYLLGYSATWIAIAWYGAMQHEFSYEALRRALHDAKWDRLCKARQFDQKAYEALQAEVKKLDKVVRSLEEL